MTQEEVLDLVKRTELRTVVLNECHAVRHSGGTPSHVKVSLESNMASGRERVDYMFKAECALSAGDSDDIPPVADISVTIVVNFSVSEGREVSEAAFKTFGEDVGILAAYPYLRQNIQDLSSRIGLPPLTLGLMRRDDSSPLSAAMFE
ncbi:hypothetical protein [Streptomyces sp. NRRL S-1824]|uniref:hypothetical protein n=1 Tax=Streptomyces sp. NRRL S-1824 TaxID=1463889 RepID=UPI00131B31B7|nr:hypothetical protein [Streptomyces sp. NRRL S-1824]